MNITFLGTDCFRPQADNDASGFLINGKYLIDTGYFLGHNLTKLGIDLLSVDRVFFTHMHHDHYLALPHLLFHWLQNGKTRSLDEMHIYGP
ncbi:MAG: MBL fold metallo-hydrolase, partial [Ruminococcaceae bacterium]|nr:MBL fold metallo-hydrolase [Oscillospiraceae bacterium]